MKRPGLIRTFTILIATVSGFLLHQAVAPGLSGNADLGAKRIAMQTAGVVVVPAGTSTSAPKSMLSVTITIPAGQTGALVATYSADSSCNLGATGTRCEVRFRTGEVADWAPQFHEFDSDQEGSFHFYEGHTVRSMRTGVPAGTYTITVVGYINPSTGSTKLTTQRSSLTVEYWRQT